MLIFLAGVSMPLFALKYKLKLGVKVKLNTNKLILNNTDTRIHSRLFELTTRV